MPIDLPQKEIVFFYADKCKQSLRASVVFDEFAHTLATPGVCVTRVNAHTGWNLVRRCRVATFPKIVLLTSRTCIHMHGEITMQAIRNFITMYASRELLGECTQSL